MVGFNPPSLTVSFDQLLLSLNVKFTKFKKKVNLSLNQYLYCDLEIEESSSCIVSYSLCLSVSYT